MQISALQQAPPTSPGRGDMQERCLTLVQYDQRAVQALDLRLRVRVRAGEHQIIHSAATAVDLNVAPPQERATDS
mgnify:CR=1 FL=1